MENEFLKKSKDELQKFREFVYQDGVLDKKTKFLIAFSNCVALGCEPCMISRFKKAKGQYGCTDEEIEEAISIAILNKAGVTEAQVKAAWKKAQSDNDNACQTCF